MSSTSRIVLPFTTENIPYYTQRKGDDNSWPNSEIYRFFADRNAKNWEFCCDLICELRLKSPQTLTIEEQTFLSKFPLEDIESHKECYKIAITVYHSFGERKKQRCLEARKKHQIWLKAKKRYLLPQYESKLPRFSTNTLKNYYLKIDTLDEQTQNDFFRNCSLFRDYLINNKVVDSQSAIFDIDSEVEECRRFMESLKKKRQSGVLLEEHEHNFLKLFEAKNLESNLTMHQILDCLKIIISKSILNSQSKKRNC